MTFLKRINNLLSGNIKFTLIIILFNVLLYFFYYYPDFLILGGEANTWINYSVLLKTFGYTWTNSETGVLSTSLSSLFIFPMLFQAMENLRLQSFLVVSSLFSLPMISFYILSKFLKQENNILFSLFFIVNPFSIILLNSLSPWMVHILILFPIYLIIIIKFFSQKLKLFTAFGITSVIFAYINANPPLAILVNIFIFPLIILAQLILKERLSIIDLVKKSLIIYSSVILFNIWWITQWFIAFSYANKIYGAGFAKSWLLGISKSNPFVFKEIFSLSWNVSNAMNYDFFSIYFNSPIVKIVLFIPFLIIIISFKKFKDKANLFLLGLILVLIFFIKGAGDPYGSFLIQCFDHVPLCKVFKTAPEKFGIFLVFFLTLLLSRLIDNRKKVYILGVYILVCSAPFFMGKFIPDHISFNQDVSRKYKDQVSYKQFREDMNNKKINFRILSLPRGKNYQIMMHNYDDKYYTGMDPLLTNITHTHIADYSGRQYDQILTEDENQKKMLALYNIKQIFLNKEQLPWFNENDSVEDHESFLEKYYNLEKDYEGMKIFNNDSYLNLVYAPKEVVVSKRTIEELPRILSQEDYNMSSAIFFEYQNDQKLDELSSLKVSRYGENNTEFKNPVLEFKKINPAKYRIRVHSANKEFPLVFSESYHDGWRGYAVSTPDVKNEKLNISGYKILDGNNDDQADKSELSNYINNGWISTLGDRIEKTIQHKKWDFEQKETSYVEKYKIDFISKNFQDTIQNENLPNGHFFECWLPEMLGEKNDRFFSSIQNNNIAQIPDDKHLMVNGYANAWIINPADICNNSANKIRCTKNPDGSYDFEIVVEFWPQRLFYAGLGISVACLLACLSCLIYNWRKKKYEKNR